MKHELHCMTEEYDKLTCELNYTTEELNMMKSHLVLMAGMERDNEELKHELNCMAEEYNTSGVWYCSPELLMRWKLPLMKTKRPR